MFHLTQKAYGDLKDIAIYTQKNLGKSQRILYVKMLDDAFHELSDNPEYGVKIKDIREGYYKYRIGSHLIYCRKISEHDIEIVRILHQRMDIES